MKKILIISHGNLCLGMLDTLKMFVTAENIHAIELDERGIDSFKERFVNFANGCDELLVLADIEGGSPYQCALEYKITNDVKIEIISGMNLPMAIEAVIGKDNTTFNKLAYMCSETGSKAIKVSEVNLNINDENE